MLRLLVSSVAPSYRVWLIFHFLVFSTLCMVDWSCFLPQVDVLPTVHGSGMFTRGQTQTLATVTLGPALEADPQR